MKRKVAIICFLGALFSGVSTIDEVKADLLWHLELEDNVLDTAGHATGPYDGTIVGEGIGGYVDGRVGRAVFFNGSVTRLDLPGTPSPLSEWTLLFWLNSEVEWFDQYFAFVCVPIWGDGVGAMEFRSSGTGHDLWINASSANLSLANDTFSAPDDVGVWIHMAMSYSVSNQESKLYVNGVLLDSTGVDVEDQGVEWDRGTNIGAWKHSEGGQYVSLMDDTAIDDVRLYDTQLSTAQISEIANTPPYVAMITETNQSTQVEELGATTDTFTIVLNNQPTNDVVVSLSKTVNGTDFTLSDATLTFTSTNWNSPQTVTVQAVNDGTVERLELGFIHFDLSSQDPTFTSAYVRDLRVDIVDDDAKQVRVTQSDDDTTVLEGGYTDDLTVSLNHAPTRDVLVTLADGSNPNLIQTDPNVLTFKPANWAAKMVTVTAMNDDVVEDDPHVASISFTVTSGDSGYNGVDVPIVYVDILENDCGAWEFSSSDLNRDCELNLEDFALLALGWLNCSSPNVEGCADYR